jgi:hypothetical protein
MAILVTHRATSFIPYRVAPVVALDSFRSSICLIGLHTDAEKERLKVARYPTS